MTRARFYRATHATAIVSIVCMAAFDSYARGRGGGGVRPGDRLVILMGSPLYQRAKTNLLRVHRVREHS